MQQQIQLIPIRVTGFHTMKRQDFNHLSASDITYIDGLYDDYKKDPDSVEESWRMFFQGFEFQGMPSGGGDIDDAKMRKEFNVFRLIQSYRSRGHLVSDTNPIRPRKDRDARISFDHFDLSTDDLDKPFMCAEFVGLPSNSTLREILDHLRAIYCSKIGVEYMHCLNTDVRRWFRQKYESEAKEINYPIDKKKRILRKLNEANVFENFLQTKFIGQKRFSLEGGETTIPAIDAIINRGAELGVKEFVIGMAHRGRLNLLANIVGKTYEYIFSEFEGGSLEEMAQAGDGDVKYHMGFTSIKEASGGQEVYLKILPNPSHLEAIAPVVMGYNRAQLDHAYGNDESKIVPIIIHGDAAVAGQGLVYECLQMSELPGYRVGGSIHFVINNQIGFTTDFSDGRSTHYCTSVAKMLDCPIIHVNGDEPESVVYAVELATEFRQKFKKDVFVDMVCYRKHGHNEGDEPKYTQPHLYGLVAKHKNPREVYLEKLLASDPEMKSLAKQMQKEFKDLLSDRLNNVKQKELPNRKKGPHKDWEKLRFSKPGDFDNPVDTTVDRKTLDKIVAAFTKVPKGFKTLKKAQKILDDRATSWANDTVDWAMAELLSYGTVLTEGFAVRFSGQDVVRGTFSHRHAKVFDEMTSEAYCGLDHIQEGQGRFNIYNSLLSEYGVLGFEYGYSQGSPWSLNIWEAQFGDFANGAQIMIDQFISAGETKWRRMCDLVMLLPHGYEGAGPEHSSARIERFLQLCAEDNMVIANCTTPANFFHALRRQIKWEFRKPLVVFTPKSLLRDSRCTSSIDDLVKGSFQEIIDDEKADAKKIKTVLMCSGKIYYQLLEKKNQEDRNDVAIVRMEQIYPLPEKQIKSLLTKYKGAKNFRWVQEEPLNIGAWTFLMRWRDLFGNFECVSRRSAASPATGFASVNNREQEDILKKAFL